MALHATVVARNFPIGWRAALLRGPSGAGKSDLALRLMTRGWRLVADDYAEVWASSGALFASAPERIAGRIEARGVGLITVPVRMLSRVVLIADCGPSAPERLPHPAYEKLMSVTLPRLDLQALEASATAKLSAALDAVVRGDTLGA